MHRLDTFPTEEIVQAYRNVFGSHDAPKVLSHMLFELGLFEDVPAMSAEGFTLDAVVQTANGADGSR